MAILPNNPAPRNGAADTPVIFSGFDGRTMIRYSGLGGSRPATRGEIALALSAGIHPIGLTCFRDLDD